MTLQKFWADRGCVVWQPYYTQVGAGTMNPATVLRVLGPEPWNVAYVEPSVRPDDGRYGDNPNRLQQHYQFQVILKPDPGNPQELYLQSLEAIGINPREHDIRFVEDNWESPALGAWGLGWEVWLDGQEITQFTYFQQAGGQVLDPVSVEITYGLERIAIALQRVRGFRDIRWVGNLTYGEINLAAEYEHSKYYFETADVERLHEMYELFQAEAENSLKAGLVLPAHDYILRCSHTFNVLDSRGAVGVTERQALFARMRDLARQVSEAYVAQRQSQGFPWLAKGETKSTALPPLDALPAAPAAAAPFLLEIGVEELPPADLDDVLAQLRERVPALLAEQHLEHGALQVMGTPRRLVVLVEALAPRQPDREVVFRGPPADRAFDAAGNPTKAAEGFARSKGLDVSALHIQEVDGGRYAVATVQENGRSSIEALVGALPGLVSGLKFGKSMRWNQTNVAFSRPVRWLAALHGQSPVPFDYAGLRAANATRGLRFYQPEQITFTSTAEYFAALKAQGIMLDREARMAAIEAQVNALAAEVGGKAPFDPGLVLEVTNLVEAPTALRGTFEESYLELPRDVLVSVMRKHQRYFPVEKDGALLPYFIAVRNGDDAHLDVVIDGNEHVIRARFSDAAFFVKNDLRRPLADYLERLDTLRFQAKLGSMLDKTRRIEGLVKALAPALKLNETEEKTAERAARLCKADLATEMVVEMTSLQGAIGQYYALKSGEPPEVAEAIFEHYLPRYTGDRSPQNKPALLIGLADRLDSLVGLFAAGLAPTGNKDPFALRRAALGLVQALRDWNLSLDLRPALRSAASRMPVEVAPEVLGSVLEFIAGRLRSMLLDEGLPYDVVDAVLAVQAHNPAYAIENVAVLAKWVARPDWGQILPAYSRCVRITRDQASQYTVNPAHFVDSAETDLYAALLLAEKTAIDAGSVDDFLNRFVGMVPAINPFFEKVLVMDNNQAVRENRLGLLQRVAGLAKQAADLSKLEGF